MRRVKGSLEGGHGLDKDIEVGTNVPCGGDTWGPAGTEVRAGEMMRNDTGVGGENKTRGHRPSLRSLDIPPAVAHLFRAPATGEDAEGLPLGGLKQLSRGSLPQRGSGEGSGVGGDRP